MSMVNRTVGECFYQVRNGANIKQGLANGGFPITRIETTANDIFNRDRMGYAGITDIGKYESYVLEDGDLLMSHINSVQYLGRTVLYKKQPGEVIIHGMNLLGLKANRNIIMPEYARYCFYSPSFRDQLAKVTKKSVNQASFTVSDLKKIVIKVPLLSEQNRTVEILDKTNRLLCHRRDEIQKLDDLIKARFIEMFDNKYPTVVLGDVIKTTSGGTPSKAHPEYYDGGTIPWLSSGEINAGVITSVKNYITEEGMRKSSAKMIPKDSVVVAMYGATAGVTGILKIETTTNQAVCSLLPTQQFIPEYLYYAVASKKDWMISQCQGGGQPNISQGIIKSMELIDAPLYEQGKFAEFVQQVDKTKAAVQKSLDEAQLLFDSLMQQYFG